MRDCFRNAARRKVVAFIRPYKLDDVKEALVQLGVQATSMDVRGFGQTRGYPTSPKPGCVRYLRKVRIEVVVRKEMVEAVLEVITRTAHTGSAGDGKIFVSRVDDAVPIGEPEADRGMPVLGIKTG
jgi:nitrogen regulatory protein PII